MIDISTCVAKWKTQYNNVTVMMSNILYRGAATLVQ